MGVTGEQRLKGVKEASRNTRDVRVVNTACDCRGSLSCQRRVGTETWTEAHGHIQVGPGHWGHAVVGGVGSGLQASADCGGDPACLRQACRL